MPDDAPRQFKGFTVSEFADALGCSPDAARALCRDGFVKAEKVDGVYFVPVEELERIGMYFVQQVLEGGLFGVG